MDRAVGVVEVEVVLCPGEALAELDHIADLATRDRCVRGRVAVGRRVVEPVRAVRAQVPWNLDHQVRRQNT